MLGSNTRMLTPPIFPKFVFFQLLEKVCLQLQSLMDDPGLKDNIELQKAMLRTFSRILPNSEPKFREECKLYHQTFLLTLTIVGQRKTAFQCGAVIYIFVYLKYLL